jgi:cytochrome c oxidase subunit IV
MFIGLCNGSSRVFVISDASTSLYIYIYIWMYLCSAFSYDSQLTAGTSYFIWNLIFHVTKGSDLNLFEHMAKRRWCLLYLFTVYAHLGAWGSVVVKALRYLSDGTGIDSRWCHWIFQWHIPSDRTLALGSTQPLVKLSTRNISWG